MGESSKRDKGKTAAVAEEEPTHGIYIPTHPDDD
jgi:hypothetical protein